MTQVIVDAELLGRLHNLRQPLQLCDASGKILARVVPVPESADYEDLEPQIRREEMQRRKQNKGRTYTTAEVLAHLEKL